MGGGVRAGTGSRKRDRWVGRVGDVCGMRWVVSIWYVWVGC